MIGFAEYAAEYARRHPGAAPQAPERAQTGKWHRLGIAAMFVASTGISGVHTVPTVYSTIEGTHVAEGLRQVVSMGSFFAVELAILITGYSVNNDRRNKIMGGLALLVAVVANIVSVTKALQAGDPAEILTALLLGVFAPVMALLAGEKFRELQVEADATHALKVADYETKLRAHNAEVNAAYEEYVARMEKRAEVEAAREERRLRRLSTVESTMENSSTEIPPGKSVEKNSTLESAGNPRKVAAEHFSMHPLDAYLKGAALVELAGRLGVSKSILYEERSKALAGIAPTISTNGNGVHDG